jgi:hypothetical protein
MKATAERTTTLIPSFGDMSPQGVGESAQVLRNCYRNVREEYWVPISRRNQDIVIRFYQALYAWKDQTKVFSSVVDMISHPNYLEIVSLGSPAVPLLLAELIREPDFLFHALTAITGVNPIRPSDYGDMDAMCAAWIKWGREEGHIAPAQHPRRN